MANGQQNLCKECGCKCNKCTSNDQDVHLHVEIENLKQKLVERDSHIATMETNVLNEANKFPNGELAAVQEELLTWQDKYRRLYEAHRRIQRVNQGLEDKLLRLVDICETEKTTLTKDVATLSHKLAEANYTIKKLTEDNERYKNDVALAIQFLQCKQGNFVSQKLDSLPNEVQAKVSSYVAGKRKPEEKRTPPEIKSIKVPIPTFPPTAMVYSIPKALPERVNENEEPESPTVDIVSAAIMAKVLQERERERALAKHCDTCTCSKNLKIIHDTVTHSVGTQTGDYKSSLCLRCNSDTNSIGVMKIVKDSGTNKSKSVPIYTHDYDSNFLQVSNNSRLVRPNVVKVEPNNYLKENNSVCSRGSGSVQNSNRRLNYTTPSNSSRASKVNNREQQDQEDTPLLDQDTPPLEQGTPPLGKATTALEQGTAPFDTATPPLGKATPPLDQGTPLLDPNMSQNNAQKLGPNLRHHHLCDKTSSGFHLEKCDLSAKNDLVKGPRYCSVRMQSGSKNILLDNVHNNVAPVLYTHPDKKSKKDDHNSKILNGITKTHDFNPVINNKPSISSQTRSYCSDICKSIKKTQSYSSDDYKSINVVGESIQNQQRVAEWIQSNQDNMREEGGSSDNSIANSLKKNKLASAIDPARYAEMESNVKKFLFGESQNEFYKKVAIGKQNYQNLRDYNSSVIADKTPVSRSNSHTETEI